MQVASWYYYENNFYLVDPLQRSVDPRIILWGSLNEKISKVSFSSDMLWLYDSPHLKNARMKNIEKNCSKLRSNRKNIPKTGNFSLSFCLLEFALSQNSTDLPEKEGYTYITNLQFNGQWRFYFILYVFVGGVRCIKGTKNVT